ncbi:hypothetical protein B0H17DRAFT_998733 [Mycena rosella]|uniref:Uncharacterized protein n=1 Tax=Mycena rosella TaxID=1033263 RepID=A0AAD7H0Q0_MYCRO|nr:hypothetical protein B0H17DRAFT_998733 [Mycena rosella]
MASGTEVGNQPLLPLSSAIPSFEFGKRKRWADLVITELVDVLLLVLSPQGKVLYCGNGLKGLLGWSDADVLEYNFPELLNAEDREGFMRAMEASLRTGNIMTSTYVRMRCVPSSLSTTSEELLFEVNGRAQIIDADDNASSPVQVFFAVAKPYPNKSAAMLDTFLDLQQENDRLQRRVAELRARAPPSAPSSPASSSASSASTPYATTSMLLKRPAPVSQSPQTYAPSPSDDVSPSPAPSRDPGPFDYPGPPPSGSAKPEEDEDPLKKRKSTQKKAAPGEQYVCITCGRTDSPEWRKGPSARKLCVMLVGLDGRNRPRCRNLRMRRAPPRRPTNLRSTT